MLSLPPFLDVTNLSVIFPSQKGINQALNGITFQVHRNEIVGVIGESGSGKSTLLRALVHSNFPQGEMISGNIFLMGQNISAMDKQDLAKVVNRNIGVVNQEASSDIELDAPVLKQITDRIMKNGESSKEGARNLALDILAKVDFPDALQRMDDKASGLSFGFLKLAAFSKAISCKPQLLILDEPFIGLDAIHQSQLMELISYMQYEKGLTCLIATHNIAVIASFSQKILVLCGGILVEESETVDLFTHPEHPYTLDLIGNHYHFLNNFSKNIYPKTVLTAVFPAKQEFCPFLPRCEYSIPRCKQEIPKLMEVGNNHSVACFVDLNNGGVRIDI